MHFIKTAARYACGMMILLFTLIFDNVKSITEMELHTEAETCEQHTDEQLVVMIDLSAQVVELMDLLYAIQRKSLYPLPILIHLNDH
ncbi:MAG: hypothetical protein AAGI23_01110 [Bacteroidota bacterium]